jgi:hypothetical protein
MLANSLSVVVAYLTIGLLVCLFARRGWPDDWDETLLASILGPPLFALLAAAAAASFVRIQLQALRGETRPASPARGSFLLRGNRPGNLVSHSDRKRLADHRRA